MVSTTFDSFYFLHIPKTAGRFFTHNVVVPINDILVKNGINSFYNRDTYVAHQFWSKDITDQTYICSILRDPVKHMVSIYSHYTMLNDGAQRAIPVGSEDHDKNTMFEWMDKYSEYVSNIQSKNFLISNPDGGFIYSESTKNCFVNNEIIFNRLNNVKLLIKSEDLKVDNIDIIHKKILKDFDIEYNKIDYKMQRASNYWNPDSTRIYKSLSSAEIDKILEFNNVDSEVYNTKSLFYDLRNSHEGL